MSRKTKGHEDGPYTNEAAKAGLKSRWGSGSGRSQVLNADWDAVSPVVVHSLVSAVAKLNGACTLGVDKLGTGYTVAVWMGGEKVLNQWFRGDAEGVEALHQMLEDFTADVLGEVRAR